MPLASGTRLGPYEIVSAIGKGGMGEVYRARDTKLDRDVAIKVLPEEFAGDAERLARFEREAKLLASLNHPNIASIYGLEESDGMKALVLELVEGPTLAERIQQGPIPVDEALAIAEQIAQALEAGHETGVIHRDLKPANVKLKEDGTVKVLDYGLAKALEGDAPTGADPGLSQSPTLTRQGTRIGVILGTAAYMSPEQAKGKRVDKRTDIWAFGAVVYEMLTGKRAFGGDDVSDTLAAVLRAEPDFVALPTDTPEPLRKALELCLTKDAKARVRDIGDVRLAMVGAFVTNRSGKEPVTKRPMPAGILAGFLLGGIVVGALVWGVRGSEPPRVMRFAAEVKKLSSRGGEIVRITADGTTLVYVGRRDSRPPEVFYRSLDEAEATAVPGTEGASNIALSPDGEWVAFFSRRARAVQKTRLSGGSVVPVVSGFVRGLSWGDDATIVYGALEGGLWRVPDTGGEPERLTEASPGRWHARPYHLPGSKGLLLADASIEDSFVAVLPRGGREARRLTEGTAPRVTSSGHLVFQREGSLWAVPFDLSRLELEGSPVPVIHGVDSPRTGAARYDVAHDGTLTYVPDPGVAGNGWIDWVDREGVVTTALENVRAIEARVAPDGNRVAVRSNDGLWIFDIARGTRSLVTPQSTQNAVWSTDGARLVYRADFEFNIRVLSLDGNVPQDAILYTSERDLVPRAWSPDRRTLVLTRREGVDVQDIWIMPIDGQPEPYLATAASEKQPALSSDGRHLAYVSDISGRDEVYVRPFPGPGVEWRISTEGGTWPAWSPNGAELLYRSQGRLMAADIDTDPPLGAGTSRVLLESPTLTGYGNAFDVSPDGQRFLFIHEWLPDVGRRSLEVVLNWSEELKRLVPIED